MPVSTRSSRAGKVVARNSDETGVEIDELDSKAGDGRSSSNDDERSPPHMGTVAQVPILLNAS